MAGKAGAGLERMLRVQNRCRDAPQPQDGTQPSSFGKGTPQCKSETRHISNQKKMHLFLKVASFTLKNAQDKAKSMEGDSASLRGDRRKAAVGGPRSRSGRTSLLGVRPWSCCLPPRSYSCQSSPLQNGLSGSLTEGLLEP